MKETPSAAVAVVADDGPSFEEQARSRYLRQTMIDHLVDLRASGKSFNQIEQETGIPAVSVHTYVREYLEESYSATGAAEMRMLQVRRLETIIGALWGQMKGGDVLTEGKNIKNLLDVLNQLTELLDLKKDKLRDEQVELTKMQTHLVRSMLTDVRSEMYTRVEDTIARLPRDDVDVANIRRELSDGWNTWWAESARGAMERNAAATVRVGG